MGWATLSFVISFVISFVVFLSAHLLSLGTGLGGGQNGELATSRQRADSGQENGLYIASP